MRKSQNRDTSLDKIYGASPPLDLASNLVHASNEAAGNKKKKDNLGKSSTTTTGKTGRVWPRSYKDVENHMRNAAKSNREVISPQRNVSKFLPTNDSQLSMEKKRTASVN